MSFLAINSQIPTRFLAPSLAATIGLLIMGGYAYFGVWKPWKQKEPERREAARVLEEWAKARDAASSGTAPPVAEKLAPTAVSSSSNNDKCP
jgi:hypothetical protein